MKATLANGATLTFPVASRCLDQFVAVFRARRSHVRRLLPPDLVPSDDGYGLTRANLYWLDAGDSDFGPYREMALTFPVREPYFGREALYYYANPITTDAACRVATEVWGHPCVLADIEVEHHDGERHVSLTLDGEVVLTLDCAPSPGAMGCEHGLVSTGGQFARTGRSEVYRFAQWARACSREDRPRDVRLSIGPHALGDTLRDVLLDTQPVRSMFYAGSTIWSGPRYSDLFNVQH